MILLNISSFNLGKMNTVCVCVAKNIVLAGVKSVTIHDPDSVRIEHLSSQVRTYLVGVGGGEGGVSVSAVYGQQ